MVPGPLEESLAHVLRSGQRLRDVLRAPFVVCFLFCCCRFDLLQLSLASHSLVDFGFGLYSSPRAPL